MPPIIAKRTTHLVQCYTLWIWCLVAQRKAHFLRFVYGHSFRSARLLLSDVVVVCLFRLGDKTDSFSGQALTRRNRLTLGRAEWAVSAAILDVDPRYPHTVLRWRCQRTAQEIQRAYNSVPRQTDLAKVASPLQFRLILL